MIIEIKEIYKCGYCNKLYQRKKACELHEESCKKRPDYIRPCHSCGVIEKVRETIWSGYGGQFGNETERIVDVLFCKKRDCFIYPPSVAAKGNWFEMEKLNIEMPKECSLYEQYNDLTDAK